MDRFELLQAWIKKLHPGHPYSIAPASADASFRRYFRVSFDDGETRIIMDAPPSHEDCRPFIHVAHLFGEAGAHVPSVFANDLEQGFLELSDLGSTTYLSALTPENASDLYADALGTLASIQRASHPGALPEYNQAHLLREMELFPVWYVEHHKGVTLTENEKNDLYGVFDAILAVNLAEPQVFVHRDYHCRNLMLSTPNPGVLDFQDAVYGPLTYDLVSLFKDAYIHWEEERTLDWLARYWETARHIGLPVRADFAEFHRDYEFMGAQRHIKVLGIFARLWHRDGKDGYLKDMPLVMHYLRAVCKRYRELHPLLRLLNKLDPEETVIGYTF
ncbi:aminoglycoside phosphotransferase family protein [Uliginosibacterium gangwonense]|uniref:aminoglycoside phosphotransferase family protein n=1 Tax=Uliginosibacterium gangwonense TaxID=392736 RepID=UPI00037D5601|nr:phosphotransferase [Uliginosibacterium gangwonense]